MLVWLGRLECSACSSTQVPVPRTGHLAKRMPKLAEGDDAASPCVRWYDVRLTGVLAAACKYSFASMLAS